MGKALYRQFRPSSFDEVIGQEHITKTLKNSIANKAIGHAYLLTGPRGVGKTSIARILAYEVNQVPYDDTGSYLDIIEIDAASNRRIDEVRDLREKVHIAPTSGRYKVYIIDEVHMLTREAFNALLKTLEEPPAHAIFILATTELHKLPDTIVSRCITFTFRPISDASIVDHLSHIASRENLKIDKEALQLLAKHGEGSFRDSISLLDQVKNTGKKISVNDVQLSLGLASQDQIELILSCVSNGNPKELSLTLDEAYLHGANEINLSKQISESLRQALLNNKPSLSADSTLDLLSDLLDVSSSPKPRVKLELCLLKQLLKNSTVKPAAIVNTVKKEEPKPSKPSPKVESATTTPETSHREDTPNIKTIKPIKMIADEEVWPQALELLKKENKILYNFANKSSASLEDKVLNIEFKDSFSYKQFTQAKNRAILMNILSELGHGDIAISTEMFEEPKKEALLSSDSVSSISNIFGNTEVLES